MTPTPAPTTQPVTVAQVSSWIAQHLPSTYGENLAGTTNTFSVRYTPEGCRIRVDVDTGSEFNQRGSSDRSKVYAVKGDARVGHHMDASFGSGVLDFTAIDPSTLRVSKIDEFIASEEVDPGQFEFAFSNQADARAMLAEMTALAQACAGQK